MRDDIRAGSRRQALGRNIDSRRRFWVGSDDGYQIPSRLYARLRSGIIVSNNGEKDSSK